MNIAELSIKKSTITWTMTILILVLGYFAYQALPRLEDPEFGIKEAVVFTPYPGASAEEVEKEVSEKIEKMLFFSSVYLRPAVIDSLSLNA